MTQRQAKHAKGRATATHFQVKPKYRLKDDIVPPDVRGQVSYLDAVMGGLCRHSFGHIPGGPLDIHAPLCCGAKARGGWCGAHGPQMDEPIRPVTFDRRIM